MNLSHNGGMGLNGYLIGLLIGLPVVLAGFLLLNRNRALQKAGVILMAAVLLGSAGLALSMRTAIVSMPAGLADLDHECSAADHGALPGKKSSG